MPRKFDETAQFISAVRTASDRARYALYVVVVATVLLFVASYNIYERSWPRIRMETWYRLTQGTPPSLIPKEIANGDPVLLEKLRDEYVKQFVQHALITTSPIPGVSIDANDIGVFGGVTLLLLMIVLAATISSEHEVVYLALKHVESLHAEEPGDADIHRVAPIYHALAMTQVLSTPPTVARWKRSPLLTGFRIVFLLPALVYAWIVWTEFETRATSLAYGIDIYPTVWFELAVLLALCILGTAATLHSRAMARRWTQTFNVIANTDTFPPQMSMAQWLMISRERSNERDDCATPGAEHEHAPEPLASQ